VMLPWPTLKQPGYSPHLFPVFMQSYANHMAVAS